MSEKQLRIFGPLAIALFQLVFFYSNICVLDLLTCSVYSVSIWECARFAAKMARRKVPGITRFSKRSIYLIALIIPLTIATTLLNSLLESTLNMSTLHWRAFVAVEGMNIIISLVIIGIYEGIYYIDQWKQLHAESEEMRKINFNTQYKFLEDQIKPHFLFNSLNTLVSLITSNPKKAEEFVEEMSAVYRYLLKKNRNELTTLREELSFLESFIMMLKTRFEESLQASIEVDRKYHEYYLPPFVLQILVENAVKHNIVSKEKPLRIVIKTDGEGNLLVSNSLQKKKVLEPSDKTGLANITERYKLLKKEDQLYILEEQDQFKVIIPLIQTSIYEAIKV
ncbi:MAG TPA: histidine kinase [Flavisolibacter sp.]|nr:histidine kinase [Flavisolibacter sp.]